MKVSVVIPLYNKERYVVRAIESVLAQSHGNFELIVVDDGSTDAGASRVAEVSDSRLRLVHTANNGVSWARNYGVAESLSEWVAFLDADDRWHPDFLSRMVALIKEYKVPSLFCSGYGFVDNGEVKKAKLIDLPKVPGPLPNYYRSAVAGDLPVTASSVMLNKAALLEIGGFPNGWSMGEDQYVWMAFANSNAIFIDPELLAFYHRGDTTSATKKNVVTAILPHVKQLIVWLEAERVPAVFSKDAQDLIHRSFIYAALGNLKLAQNKEARELLKSAYVRRNHHWMAAYLLSFLPTTVCRYLIENRL